MLSSLFMSQSAGIRKRLFSSLALKSEVRHFPHFHDKKEIKKEEKLISTATGTIISIGVFHDNSIAATLAAPLDFKLFNLLKNMLLQSNHLLFFRRHRI